MHEPEGDDQAKAPSKNDTVTKHKTEKSEDDFGDLIPDKVEPILNKLPEDDKLIVTEVIAALSIKSRIWSGPLPPPDVLKGYNECFPKGAEEIFSMVREQAHHRMEIEKATLRAEIKQAATGQIFAFIIALAFLFVSGFLIYTGFSVAGTILGTVDLVALVIVFILGRYNKSRSSDIQKP